MKRPMGGMRAVGIILAARNRPYQRKLVCRCEEIAPMATYSAELR